MARTWICRRRSNKVVCGQINPKRNLICTKCGKKRPATKKPAHMAVLDIPYERWIEVFGETCGICGKGPSLKRRLDRDHDHKTGAARGLLCSICNKRLTARMTDDWMKAAIAYLLNHTNNKSMLY